MLTKERVIIPTDINNMQPPAFVFTLLAVTRFRLRLINSLSRKTSTIAPQTISDQISRIETGILHYIDMSDQARWEFFSDCFSYIRQPFCESCWRDISNNPQDSTDEAV